MSLKERGVAVLLAAENAETIEPTAKWKSLTYLLRWYQVKSPEIPCLFWELIHEGVLSATLRLALLI
jgi:hypothetical protein